MQEQLERIKQKLDAGTFANEAAISQGAVLPIINALGWETQDTDEVAPEWTTTKGRVDFAICLGKPRVFVEVKQPGRFESGIEQLLQYAFTEGVPMAVLSDGCRWSVYLPGEAGSYIERRVDHLDVVERSLENVEKILRRYLGKEEVSSGAYLDNAQKDLHSATRRQRAKDTIPKAWSKLLEEPDGLIAEYLIETVEEEAGVAPSEEDVRNFLETVLKNIPVAMPTETRKTRPPRIAECVPDDPAQAFEKAVTTAQFKPKKPSTTENYRRRWLAFTEWSTGHGENWLPAKPEQVKSWIAHEWPTKRARTLTHDLRAVSLVHRAFGMKDPARHGSPARNLRRQFEKEEKQGEKAS